MELDALSEVDLNQGRRMAATATSTATATAAAATAYCVAHISPEVVPEDFIHALHVLDAIELQPVAALLPHSHVWSFVAPNTTKIPTWTP